METDHAGRLAVDEVKSLEFELRQCNNKIVELNNSISTLNQCADEKIQTKNVEIKRLSHLLSCAEAELRKLCG